MHENVLRSTLGADTARKSGPVLQARTDHPIVKPSPRKHFSTAERLHARFPPTGGRRIYGKWKATNRWGPPNGRLRRSRRTAPAGRPGTGMRRAWTWARARARAFGYLGTGVGRRRRRRRRGCRRESRESRGSGGWRGPGGSGVGGGGRWPEASWEPAAGREGRGPGGGEGGGWRWDRGRGGERFASWRGELVVTGIPALTEDVGRGQPFTGSRGSPVNDASCQLAEHLAS